MLERLLRKPTFRFLFSGGLNTALTWLLYLLLLNVLSYRVSYTLAFATGIALAYLLNRTFVFRSHRGLRSVLWMPLIYLAQYLTGLLVVWLWVEKLHWPEQFAPLVAVLITLPLNYAASRFAFISPRKNDLS